MVVPVSSVAGLVVDVYKRQVHDGHACQRPVLGGGRQHAVDLYLVGLHAFDQLLGVVRQVAVLGQKPLARGHDAGIGALYFARVQHLQRAAARVRALVSFCLLYTSRCV